jgi:hypothetical protein
VGKGGKRYGWVKSGRVKGEKRVEGLKVRKGGIKRKG